MMSGHPMNFNVHRRNKPLFSASKLRDKRDQKSGKKVPHSSAEALLLEAKELYHAQTNLDDAIALFDQYLALHPKHSEALYLCAVSLLHVGRAEQAIDRLSAISDEYENKANALLLAAMAYNKLGTSFLIEATSARAWRLSMSAFASMRCSRRPCALGGSCTWQ
jgi:tetratricopeptide (TPR) repeat protein